MDFIIVGPYDNPETLNLDEYQERQDYYNSLSIDHEEWREIDKIMELI